MAKSQEASERVRVLSQDISEREGRIAGLLEEVAEAGERARSLDQAVEVRDGRIAELSLEVEEARERARSLDEAVEVRDGRIAELLGDLEVMRYQAESLDHALVERDGRLADLKGQLMQYESQVHSLESEIFEMRRSIVWHIVMMYHNGFVERLLPHSTRRRYIYDLSLSGGRIFVNEGGARFLQCLKCYSKNLYRNKFASFVDVDMMPVHISSNTKKYPKKNYVISNIHLSADKDEIKMKLDNIINDIYRRI